MIAYQNTAAQSELSGKSFLILPFTHCVILHHLLPKSEAVSYFGAYSDGTRIGLLHDKIRASHLRDAASIRLGRGIVQKTIQDAFRAGLAAHRRSMPHANKIK